MGISLNPLFQLLENKNRLGDVICYGRQFINIKPEQRDLVNYLFNKYQIDYDADRMCEQRYADELFLKIGAKSITWLDFSSYEGATFICDLNKPLLDCNDRFDTVVDGGTIEHIFNVPQAFLNTNSLLKRGGAFCGISPGNNFMGHGMYQFSPELYYAGLRSCGFQIDKVSIMVRDNSMQETLVPDPHIDGKRREIRVKTLLPVDIFCVATKSFDVTELMDTYQADYKAAWEQK